MSDSPSINTPETQRTSPSPSRRAVWVSIFAMCVIATLGIAAFYSRNPQHAKIAANVATTKQITSQTPTTQTTTTATQPLQLDTTKSYGNTYASGILPVGDGHYTTTQPKQGYVYACSQYAQNLTTSSGGAQTRGPWFTSNNTAYNMNEKIHVAGNVMWQASFTNTLSTSTRTIVTNDLPDHPTGTFPIAVSDPAYAYDHNPNSIRSQKLTYTLNAKPTYGAPNCMGGESGIMLTGIALFNAFDAGGRDAGAWEVQDSCSGHPQMDGIYHYHTLSSCIKDTSVHTVIGFALDGFPITGPQVSMGNVLTTKDLDVCHGITSQILLDGKSVTMYHYVMTQDFPYSVSCFRGQAVQPPDLAMSKPQA
jgi:hypothetical protein